MSRADEVRAMPGSCHRSLFASASPQMMVAENAIILDDNTGLSRAEGLLTKVRQKYG